MDNKKHKNLNKSILSLAVMKDLRAEQRCADLAMLG